MTAQPRGVSAFLGEYVAWGGPIVTRAEAYADAVRSGFSRQAIDWLVFARAAVSAPDDPAAESAWLREIVAAEAAVAGTARQEERP